MDRVIILGTASAVPDAQHENTHLLAQTGARAVLVDCPGSPVVRLEQAGVALDSLTDIILTHFHPDHVSGFAPLVMSLWLLGRKAPLNVHGLAPTVERARVMMDLYDWQSWPNFYPLHFVPVEATEHATVIDAPDLRVFASPVAHLIPTIGLRFEFPQSGEVVAYSCDTEPSQAVRRLAEGARALIHEATGSSSGHTSPEQAGEIAAQAGVRSLYLVHYPPQLVTADTLAARAAQTFDGEIIVGQDLMTIPLGG